MSYNTLKDLENISFEAADLWCHHNTGAFSFLTTRAAVTDLYEEIFEKEDYYNSYNDFSN